MQVTSTLDTLTKDEWHESIALWLRDCGIKKTYPTGCGIKKNHVIPWDTRDKFIPLRPYHCPALFSGYVKEKGCHGKVCSVNILSAWYVRSQQICEMKQQVNKMNEKFCTRFLSDHEKRQETCSCSFSWCVAYEEVSREEEASNKMQWLP